MTYCIDTSSLLTGWNDRYPPEIFPTLWENFEILIEDQKLVSPIEVYYELEKQDDTIKSWVDHNKTMFQPLDEEVQEIASEILASHPTLIDINRPTYQADPFIIALAVKQDCVVVTQEIWTNSPKRTKIPNVCAAYDVMCIDLLNMVQELKWTF